MSAGISSLVLSILIILQEIMLGLTLNFIMIRAFAGPKATVAADD